jgi:hypothetical protein
MHYNYGTNPPTTNNNAKACFICSNIICTIICNLLALLIIDSIAIAIGVSDNNLQCFENARLLSLSNYLIINASVNIVTAIIIMISILIIAWQIDNNNSDAIFGSVPLMIIVIIWYIFSIIMFGIGIAELDSQYVSCEMESHAIAVMTVIVVVIKGFVLFGICGFKCCYITYK